MIRYITTASHEPEATTTELLEYLADKAPVGATAGQVRAIAFLWSSEHPVMRELRRGAVEVDAQELLQVATNELAKAEPNTIAALALQALVNWLLVGSGKVQEVRRI